jgi:DNA repair protein RadC
MSIEWMIRDLPEGERPRERLLEQGSGALSDAELVAVLLRTGRVGSSAIDLARELLCESGGLPGLLSATGPSLCRKGIGPAKAAGLLAALEMARRLARGHEVEREPLRRREEMVRYLGLRYRVRDQEVLGALFLDSRGRLIGEREIYRGTLDRAAVEPREVLKECLIRGAAAVILFHNHPSGDPSPSLEDIEFTRQMAEAARVLDIHLADHLILGEGERWASLRDRVAW